MVVIGAPAGGAMNRGYLQVYTGDGKGKTTAALGLAVRAVGAGLSVCVLQFVKSVEYHELGALRRLGIPVHLHGRGCIFGRPPSPEDRAAARSGMSHARELLSRAGLDLLILDEVNVAAHLGLIEVAELVELVRTRPAGVELVCTGRSAPRALLEHADLVTEMKSVRHYYDAGVTARDGIER
jgi:cob(I)alamin adenosyltransferase